MKFVYIRYNDSDYAACLANAVQNVTQMPGIATHDNLGSHLGRHPNNEHDLQPDDAELTNAIAFLVTSGHALGVPGHYLNGSNALVHGDRRIEPRDAVYRVFQPNDNSELFRRMISGPNPNKFMFVRFVITYITVDGSEPEVARHWGSITYAGDDVWWFGHGTKSSNPKTIQQRNLTRLLFSERGRSALFAVVRTDFGGPGAVIVEYDEHMFLAMPEIQLLGPRDMSGWSNAKINQLPCHFVKNGNTTTSKKMHFCQIMETDEMETLESIIDRMED